MKSLKRREQTLKKTIRVMKDQLKTLSTCNADKEILDTYLQLIEFIEKTPFNTIFSNSVEQPPQTVDMSSKFEGLPFDKDIAIMPLADIEIILQNDKIQRKYLEMIAIKRFDVPKGSLSSYSNIPKLKEKINTLIQNEKAHNTISSVAKKSKT
ncbi:hypothetical protein [Terasakiella sp.]|uniref:hypothetical protein n=1 Tax=Terasakiella sp. TaxID=2034861 RepID=UPI003AA7B47E